MSLFPKFKASLDPVATLATSATPPPQSSKSSESSNPLQGEVDYRTLYQQTAEAIREDCFLIDPAWLLDHPGFYERIRDLDEQLSMMNEEQPEYRATLARMVALISKAKTACENNAVELI